MGKATTFKPLSVRAGKKKKKKKPAAATVVPAGVNDGDANGRGSKQTVVEIGKAMVQEEPAPPPSKPKTSLFSLAPAEQTDAETQSTTNTYEALITAPQPTETSNPATNTPPHPADPQPSSLHSLTQGFNLTPAQRRQIFGRNAKRGKEGDASNINMTHFDTSAEYAANEIIRHSSETIQHKAVKAVAPGKHSLQQLVNNARSQQENLEDKWAEGRVKRGQRGQVMRAVFGGGGEMRVWVLGGWIRSKER